MPINTKSYVALKIATVMNAVYRVLVICSSRSAPVAVCPKKVSGVLMLLRVMVFRLASDKNESENSS